MDKTAYAGRSNPPWRPSQLPHKATHAQVDSWRSYRNDATNLQTSTASTLNAEAQPFQPSLPPRRCDSPCEPLRASDGGSERNIADATSVSKNKGKKSKRQRAVQQQLSSGPPPAATQPVEAPTSFTGRYPVRSNRGLANQPIPSIEEPILSHIPTAGTAGRRLDTKRQSPTKSPEAPETTVEYRTQAQKEPARLPEPRKLLVVLDLNGTLLYRKQAGSIKKVHVRPGVTTFIDYLFTNHVVMVYTSAMPNSAAQMVSQFLHPKHRNQLAAVWARDKLDLTDEQFANKVQVYKKLDKIWQDEDIQKTAGAGDRWQQSNTILVDDSKMKAMAQPHNLLQVPEYTANDDPARAKGKSQRNRNHKAQQDILKQLEMKLEELKYQEDVSRLIRKWQMGEIKVPRIPGQEIVVEENVDQKIVKEKESKETIVHSQPQPHLPTPDSMCEVSTRDDVPVQLIDDEEEQEEEDKGAPLSPAKSIVSSVDEDVFRELLEGTGK